MNDDRTITISLEEVISNMLITKEQKEELYRGATDIPEDKGTIIWENDRIVGMRMHEPMEYIKLTVKINDKGEVEIE